LELISESDRRNKYTSFKKWSIFSFSWKIWFRWDWYKKVLRWLWSFITKENSL